MKSLTNVAEQTGGAQISGGVGDGVYNCNTQECCYEYDPGRAAAYATRNATVQPAPGYENLSGSGGDCANFVSQALHYGGLPMEGKDNWTDWDNGWRCKENSGGICASQGGTPWTVAPELRDYLLGMNGVHRSLARPPAQNTVPTVEEIAALANVRPGDVLYVPSDIEHVAVVVSWGPSYASWNDFNTGTNPGENVPYIADHGVQSDIPRPYYFIGWSMSDDLGAEDYYSLNSQTARLEFLHIPRQHCLAPEDVAPPFTPPSR